MFNRIQSRGAFLRSIVGLLVAFGISYSSHAQSTIRDSLFGYTLETALKLTPILVVDVRLNKISVAEGRVERIERILERYTSDRDIHRAYEELFELKEILRDPYLSRYSRERLTAEIADLVVDLIQNSSTYRYGDDGIDPYPQPGGTFPSPYPEYWRYPKTVLGTTGKFEKFGFDRESVFVGRERGAFGRIVLTALKNDLVIDRVIFEYDFGETRIFEGTQLREGDSLVYPVSGLRRRLEKVTVYAQTNNLINSRARIEVAGAR